MSQSTIGSVTHGTSGIGDFRFLNPFYKMDHGEKGAMYGTRYGYSQFLYIACAFISLIIVAIYSNSKTVFLQVVILSVTYFFMYYNLSCYLVPNNHDRCSVLVFLMILFVIASTLLSILSSSILKDASKSIGSAFGTSIIKKPPKEQQEGGAHCYKKDKKEQEGGDNCGTKKEEQDGGAHCYKKDKKEQEGGAHCYKKDKKEQDGGAHCYKKNKKEQEGGDNCGTEKKQQEGGYFKY